MPWHKPRFKITNIMMLIAVVAAELALIRQPLSWIIASLSLSSALLASCLGPITKFEWFGIISIHILLWSLLQPTFDSWHCIP